MTYKVSFSIVLIFLCLGMGAGFFAELPAALAMPDGEVSGQALPFEPLRPAAASPSFSGCGGVLVGVQHEAFEQELAELLNSSRAAHNLPPLKRVVELDWAARYHAADMAYDDYFQHDTYDRVDGRVVKYCNWNERLVVYYSDQYASMGENIAAGYHTPESVFQGWMNSPAHRANILSPDFWEFGVGYYLKDGDYTRYWVMDFGRLRNRFPLIIQQDALRTYRPEVELFVYGSWQEMRLKSGTGDWTAWQPFQPRLPWSLERAAGEHTVTVELRSGQTSYTTSDTILLEQLSGLWEELHFSYSQESGQVYPPFYDFYPRLNGAPQSFTWQLSSSADWLQVSPAQGNFYQAFRVQPADLASLLPGAYSGEAALTATNPAGVMNSPFTMTVSLFVSSEDPYPVYLPLLRK
jgi:uncharacterized protein YkwD